MYCPYCGETTQGSHALEGTRIGSDSIRIGDITMDCPEHGLIILRRPGGIDASLYYEAWEKGGGKYLTEKQHEACERFYGQGMTKQEIAQELGITTNAVIDRLKGCKHMLKVLEAS